MEIPIGSTDDLAGLINALSVGEKRCFIFNNVYFTVSLDGQVDNYLVKAIPCGENSADAVNYEPGEFTRLVTEVFCDATYPIQVQSFVDEVASFLTKKPVISCDGVYNGAPAFILEV